MHSTRRSKKGCPCMHFPNEATPEQEARIKAYLFYLEHEAHGGFESLCLDEVRFLGDPQFGYLLVKAWVSVLQNDKVHHNIPKVWFELLKRPNEYLNPAIYIPADNAIDALFDI